MVPRKGMVPACIALEGFTAETAAQRIDEGVRICAAGGPQGEETAAAGRAYANRVMPV